MKKCDCPYFESNCGGTANDELNCICPKYKAYIATKDEKQKALLYSIRTKIEQDPQNTSFISSTTNIMYNSNLFIILFKQYLNCFYNNNSNNHTNCSK